MKYIDNYCIYEEYLLPKEYLALSAKEKSNIESSEIISPQLGSGDFGRIKVLYKIPKYRKYK